MGYLIAFIIIAAIVSVVVSFIIDNWLWFAVILSIAAVIFIIVLVVKKSNKKDNRPKNKAYHNNTYNKNKYKPQQKASNNTTKAVTQQAYKLQTTETPALTFDEIAAFLAQPISKQIDYFNTKQQEGFKHTDGYLFEYFIINMFEHFGYKCIDHVGIIEDYATKTVNGNINDRIIDIIFELNDTTVFVQCKCYSKNHFIFPRDIQHFSGARNLQSLLNNDAKVVLMYIGLTYTEDKNNDMKIYNIDSYFLGEKFKALMKLYNDSYYDKIIHIIHTPSDNYTLNANIIGEEVDIKIHRSENYNNSIFIFKLKSSNKNIGTQSLKNTNNPLFFYIYNSSAINKDFHLTGYIEDVSFEDNLIYIAVKLPEAESISDEQINKKYSNLLKLLKPEQFT